MVAAKTDLPEKRTFLGSPTEFAEHLLHESGNPKEALIQFLTGNYPSKASVAEEEADGMAHAVLDRIDGLLGETVMFREVSDAVYLIALEAAAYGMEWFGCSLKEKGVLQSGLDMRTGSVAVPEAEPVSEFDPPCVLMAGRVRLFISEHKFGAYPDVAVLLSDSAATSAKQIDDLRERDMALDPCKGVWRYRIKEVDCSDTFKFPQPSVN